MTKTLWGTLGAIVLACAALGSSLVLGTHLSNANSEIGRLQRQVVSLRASSSSLSTKLTHAEQTLTQAEQKLTSGSLSGDVITCSDLKNMEENLPISLGGQDDAGDNLSGGLAYVSGPWLPNHCYKK